MTRQSGASSAYVDARLSAMRICRSQPVDSGTRSGILV
jgi:hypothetical protein